MTTEDISDGPPTSCWSCSSRLTDEESSDCDGATKEDQLCAVCRAEQIHDDAKDPNACPICGDPRHPGKCEGFDQEEK